MKAIRMQKPAVSNDSLSFQEQMLKGHELEKNGSLEEASALYEHLIKRHPLSEEVYHRLMIVYRKLKRYDEELRTINTAVKTFEEHFGSHQSKPAGKKIEQVSHLLVKRMGLVDKKVKPMYQPEPIASWMKRKATLHKKMHK